MPTDLALATGSDNAGPVNVTPRRRVLDEAVGSRFVETMLTVTETCRQQGRNVFAFLTTAV